MINPFKRFWPFNSTPFSNFHFLEPVFAERGYSIRKDLSEDQLKKCDKAAKELIKIVSSINFAKNTGRKKLSLYLGLLWGERRGELANYLKNNCLTKTPPPQPETQSDNAPDDAAAFWTATSVQLIGTAQQLGRDIEDAANATSTQIIGAAAFLGLAAAAVARLRFGDTSLLQRLIPAL